MLASTSIEIPKDILLATRMTPAELRLELAITLFQQGKLSFGKAREMADLDAWTFQQLLGGRGIPPHYDILEYEEDLTTLSEIDARSWCKPCDKIWMLGKRKRLLWLWKQTLICC